MDLDQPQLTPETKDVDTLVVLAAGLGSRFGGDKPLATFSSRNITLMELNIFAAHAAGFTRVVVVVSRANEQKIREQLARNLPEEIVVTYCSQRLDDVPVIGQVERSKPWGTAHALWCCRTAISRRFVVINGDDFYGEQAFLLAKSHAKTSAEWAMVGYALANTLSPYGGVNRGFCQVVNRQLVQIDEIENIERLDSHCVGWQASQQISLANDSVVSMNFWLLDSRIFSQIEQALTEFIQSHNELMTAECQLPAIVAEEVAQGRSVSVYLSNDHWFGLTFPQDSTIAEGEVSGRICNYPYNKYVRYNNEG